MTRMVFAGKAIEELTDAQLAQMGDLLDYCLSVAPDDVKPLYDDDVAGLAAERARRGLA